MNKQERKKIESELLSGIEKLLPSSENVSAKKLKKLIADHSNSIARRFHKLMDAAEKKKNKALARANKAAPTKSKTKTKSKKAKK